MNRYFEYCRKSTEDEDHQVLSIESQRSELARYAERENLRIIETREEAKSAKAPGRPIFDELLRRIERGEADGILAWHPDRLARNALDGGKIIHLLDAGKLVSLKFPTYTFENTSQGKFMLAIMFGQSKYYVDSLIENIRRGNRARRARGWMTSKPPMGYLNGRSSTGEKIIIPDPLRFPILQKLWQLFLSGGFSVSELRRIANIEMGLRTIKRRRSGGNPLSVSGIYRIFSNPVYAGLLIHQGQTLPGRHQPMVSRGEFERAQMLLGRKNRARGKTRGFAYTGIIHCGSCGGSITAEDKTNRFGTRYVYYHCTHKKAGKPCREKCLEEKQLEKQVLVFLRNVALDRAETERALEAVEKARKAEGAETSIRVTLEQALAGCTRRMDNLTKLRLRDFISDEEFVRQRMDLNREEAVLKERIAKLQGEEWIEPSRNLFQFGNRAAFWLTHGTKTEKRLILATVGSNLSLKAKELCIDAAKPFLILEKRPSIPNWWTVINDVRTFFRENPEVVIPALPEPQPWPTS